VSLNPLPAGIWRWLLILVAPPCVALATGMARARWAEEQNALASWLGASLLLACVLVGLVILVRTRQGPPWLHWLACLVYVPVMFWVMLFFWLGGMWLVDGPT
jgi:hypothetical protein